MQPGGLTGTPPADPRSAAVGLRQASEPDAGCSPAPPDAWARFVQLYRREPLLPHLWSPAWLCRSTPDLLTNRWALLAADENGDATRRPLVVTTGDASWRAQVATLDAGHPAPLAVLVPERPGLEADLGAAGLGRRSTWMAMGAPVPEPRSGGAPAPSLAERGDRADALVRMLNPAFTRQQGLRPLTTAWLRDLTTANPLWDPRNLFLVVEGPDVVASARVNVEERHDGSRFGFVRWMTVAASRQGPGGLGLMTRLYDAVVGRLCALGVPTWHLKVVPENRLLHALYRRLGFEDEGLVSLYSGPQRPVP